MGLKRMLAACVAIVMSLCVLPGVALAATDGLQVSSLGQTSRITTASADADDEEEPNDTYDTAQEIKLNTTYYGMTDYNSGLDRYKVTCPLNGTIRITMWNGQYKSFGGNGSCYISWTVRDSDYNEKSSGSIPVNNTNTHWTTYGVSAGESFYFTLWNGRLAAGQPYHFTMTYEVGETDITSTTSGEKQFKVAWTKKAKASFYQVRYVKQSVYDDYGWDKAKVKKVASSNGSCTVTGLAANSTYQVQVRVARTIDGETYYSDWSDAVQAKTVTKISQAKVAIASAGAYTGKAKKPSVTVTCNGSTLRQGTHYTLSYSNNVKAGKAFVTVKGKGYYTGSVKRAFTIAKAGNSVSKVEGKLATVERSTVKKGVAKVKASKAYRNLGSANGTVTFEKVKSGSSKSLSVNKKTGKIEVKKGTEKGVYTIKVRVKAAGDSCHKAGSKVVKVRIRVK